MFQYQFYGGGRTVSGTVGRQYTTTRTDPFQHQLVSSILCQPTYQVIFFFFSENNFF